MKRLIVVLKKYEPELRAAIAAAAKGVAGGLGSAAGADVYVRVKAYLAARNVPHEDKHAHPHTISADHVYYHH